MGSWKPSTPRLAHLLMFAAAAVLVVPAQQARAQAAKIKHIVIIMQENRSFDSYFGTFPGASGFPSGTCEPITAKKPAGACVVPFHDPLDVNAGGGHHPSYAQHDLDDGINTLKLDGFIDSQSLKSGGACNRSLVSASCLGTVYGVMVHDVMGYHDGTDIPNYWAYAKQFVLQDALFEGERSWSYPSHLDMTSEWSAVCSDNTKAMSCVTEDPVSPTKTTQLPWANLFQLLDVHKVSWKYYLGSGTEPDCEDGEMTCEPQVQNTKVPSFWNPAPLFMYVKQQGAQYLKNHVSEVSSFIDNVQRGHLPQVSWIVPSDEYSEHPPAGVTVGMEYVTSLVNAVAASPYWADTAIFIAWDDWGGFYDHVGPPNVYYNATKFPVEGFGLRVPGILVSAWAKPGLVDHQVYSFASYATLMEDLFAGGARLDPTALGNPDKRGVIRDSIQQVTFMDGHTAPIGNLMSEFDFTQQPIPPMILSTHIPTGIFASCGQSCTNLNCKTKAVTISWNPVAGAHVPGPFTYHVERDGTDLPACAVTASTCTDKPGSGTHFYVAYSVSAGGDTSPRSAATVAIMP